MSKLSKCVLLPGDWSLDRKGFINSVEFHYMISDWWGTVYLLGTNGAFNWHPCFQDYPNWTLIEQWLLDVESEMGEAHNINAKGLNLVALRDLQQEWEKTT